MRRRLSISFVLILAAATAAFAACPRPAARAYHAMVYDEARRQVLVFGGQTRYPNPVVEDDDLWMWDGSAWTSSTGPGPAAREDAVFVYDSGRERAVLYGGRDGMGRFFRDTWEWDGAAWTLADAGLASNPGPRAHAAAAYDRSRGKVVLFGGYDPGQDRHFADTWEWDGAMWERRDAAGPTARVGHAMTYDNRLDAVLLYGGSVPDAGLSTETWTWDGATWTRQSTSGPAVMTAVTSLGEDGPVLLFGGWNGRRSVDATWEWDGTRWVQLGIRGPKARSGFGIVYDAARETTVLFAGVNNAPAFLKDVWEYRDGAWSKRPKCP